MLGVERREKDKINSQYLRLKAEFETVTQELEDQKLELRLER